MAIVMSGGVYCPLSPRDPELRLHALVQQTGSRLVLVHHLTKTKFNDDIVLLNIDSVLINDNTNTRTHVEPLSSIEVSPDNIAYVIFTSGSTGIPKAVSISVHDPVKYSSIFHLFKGSSSTSKLY
jgi:non-ribosomal peptide synthetase component F